ncbi:MAG TPA: tetratricopeptide repeat protein [Kofleriaceae bacterium]
MADPDKSSPTPRVEDGWDEPPDSVKQTVADPSPPRPRSPSRANLPGLPPDQNSLALLAKDLMPPPPVNVTMPEVRPVTDPKVQFPGVWITVRNWLRRYAGKLRSLIKNHRMIAIAAGGTLLVVIVIAIVVLRGGSPKQTRGAKLAKQGQELLNKNDAKHAAELIESELVGTPQPDDGQAYLVLGHARFAMKRNLEALTAYERALTLSPTLASDSVLRANATKVLDSKDSVAAVVALELLASRVSPPAHDVVIQYASTGKLADARRRAFAIAEREGIADKVDRVESWSLDLASAGTCEDRRTIIAKLASTKDKRALPALKRAKLYKCAEKDATDAMEAIEGKPADAKPAEPAK